MEKLKKFCQKPLFIISIALISVCFIAVIIMMCIPHGKRYVLNYEVNGVDFKYEIVLGDKYKQVHTYTIDGKTYNVENADTKEYGYEVNDGELYIVDGGVSNQKVKIGNINSRRITLKYNILGDAEKTTLVCKVNRVLTNIFVVGLYVGIALCVASVIVICVDKKSKITPTQKELLVQDNKAEENQ